MTGGPYTAVEGGIIANAGGDIGTTDERLGRIEGKLDAVLDAHDKRISRIEQMIDHGSKGMLLLALGALFGSLKTAIASAHHWIGGFR